MSAAKLITELQSRGVEITAAGDRLKIKAPKGTITPELRARLVADKTEILYALQMPARWRLMEIAREATKGTLCDPRDLADFLTRCNDPGWCTPLAARWWARYHAKHGGFPE